MFGKNETLPQVNEGGAFVRVQEAFSTIQGEGPLAGVPATFIRLYGCHLKCWFCDTDFSSIDSTWTVEELVEYCRVQRNELVVLTGGEPLRQNITPLCFALLAAGHRVQVETAGNLWFAWNGNPKEVELVTRHLNFSVVISPKTPSTDERFVSFVRDVSWKYVVAHGEGFDSTDGLPVVNYQKQGGRARRLARPWSSDEHAHLFKHKVYVQPMDVPDEGARQLNIRHAVSIVRDYGYRLSLQQHKLLGLP